MILGVAPPHPIDQSIRFNQADSPYMQKTYSGDGSRTTWSFSFWTKLGKSPPYNTTRGKFLIAYNTTSGAQEDIRIEGSNQQLQWFTHNDGGTGTLADLKTTQYLRDHSAWYHILCVADRTNAVAEERQRMYINGQRVTDFATETYPSKDAEGHVGKSADVHYIGSRAGNSSTRIDGYMAEINYLDGLAYDPSFFGEFNSSGIWIPKQYSGSYGTNGFYLKGESASDLGNDSSGNGNDFTTSGLASHDQVLDSPTNNWCVMNPLADYYANHTFRNGNLELLTSTTTNQYTYSINNIGMSSGKWYAEAYIDNTNAGQILIGISDRESQGGTHYLGSQSYEYSYYSNNGKSINGGTQSTYGNTFTTDDIIGIALDLDNSKLYFSKNGTFQNSGVPTSGSTGTGAVSITAVGSTRNGHYFFAVGDYSNAGNITVYWNFGQEGTFAGNTTAGGNSDSNGVGNFKYSVPSGYLALCTKNLGS